MIHTSTQLKAKVHNLSHGDSTKSQIFLRNFIMERFLERISLSDYRNNFVLKGGMLVAAVVGLDARATMDIDTTIRSIPFTKEQAARIIEDIIAVAINDDVTFSITKITDIMEGHDYPGIRLVLEARLDKLRQAIKVDISTGDVITPGAIEYAYRLMFEERAIMLWTYNIETLLAEKLETIMTRGVANTRMRDYYDIHVITTQKTYHNDVLRKAFLATSDKRQTTQMISELDSILRNVIQDKTMRRLWQNYAKNSFFVRNLSWDEVMTSVINLAKQAQLLP